MTSASASWRFQLERSPSLPALAWVAWISRGEVRVRAGRSVREDEGGFFEGTWAGAPRIHDAARSTTTFGSGIVRDGHELIVVPPAHTLEPVYSARASDGTLVVSNSFVGILAATGRALDPTALYPPLFGLSNRGLTHATFDVPTASDPITVHYFENLRVNADGTATVRPKPREGPFRDYEDYRDRLIERTRSCFANAVGYSPGVALSSGYDSTAGAAVAAQAGCRRALTFRTGWPWAGYSGEADSGEAAANALGMTTEFYDRLAYQALDDAPEAEFLASGMSGEDIVYRSMEAGLNRTVLITGFWGGAAWRGHARPNLSRIDLSGASLTELRLRTDMIHVPLPYIGGTEQPSFAVLRRSPDMQRYAVGGAYDEPLARRLAEEAGVPRDAFAVQKLATSQRIQTYGLGAMSKSGLDSFERFAGPERIASLPRKDVIRGRHRAAIKLARALHAGRLVSGLVERRWRVVHIEPVLGSLLLRWAVEQVRSRYDAVASDRAPAGEISEGAA